MSRNITKADRATQLPRPAPGSARFRGYLGAQRLKMTRERRLILDAVHSMEGHFGADDLHQAIRSGSPGVSRATVYRTLEHLVASGLVQKVFLSDHSQRKALYEVSHGRDHHEHMHCLSCGKIIEFTDDPLERRQDLVCRRLGFQPIRHSLRIEGICKDCRGEH